MKIKFFSACSLGLCVLIIFTSVTMAQVPGAVPGGAPGAAPGVAPPGAAGAAAGAAGGAGNIWGMLCPTPEQKQAWKLRFCKSPLGKIYSSMVKPMAAFSGGLIEDRCVEAAIAEGLKQPADSAEGAAARILADEAEAKKRRAAVRILGTVDCKRWPEAEEALINALRGDRNECVRWEAAKQLGRGCCCTPKTVTALSLTIAGSNRDGFPVERSDRVVAAAVASLNHCLNCLAEHMPPLVPPPIGTPVPPKKDKKDGKEVDPDAVLPALTKVKAESSGKKTPPKGLAFYRQLEKLSMVQAASFARRKLEKADPGETDPFVPQQVRQQGLLAIMSNAIAGPRSQVINQEIGHGSPGNVVVPLAPSERVVPVRNRDVVPAGHIVVPKRKSTLPKRNRQSKKSRVQERNTPVVPASHTTVIPEHQAPVIHPPMPRMTPKKSTFIPARKVPQPVAVQKENLSKRISNKAAGKKTAYSMRKASKPIVWKSPNALPPGVLPEVGEKKSAEIIWKSIPDSKKEPMGQEGQVVYPPANKGMVQPRRFPLTEKSETVTVESAWQPVEIRVKPQPRRSNQRKKVNPPRATISVNPSPMPVPSPSRGVKYYTIDEILEDGN